MRFVDINFFNAKKLAVPEDLVFDITGKIYLGGSDREYHLLSPYPTGGLITSVSPTANIIPNVTLGVLTADLTTTTVTAGSYTSANITVDAWGRITAAASGGGGGTVTAVSVVTANGFAGSSSGGATPALTLTTTVTGLLKGNGTAISAAVAGTDYQAPITFTTTGTSGAATFVGNALNIPVYQAAGTYVTTVGATSPITSSGGTTPTISTSMNTNKLIGRGTIGVGVMEEITLGTNLALAGTTLNVTGVPTVTPAALTKVDDTNVTLALGGTPATALLQATSLTLGWTGTLADGRIASATNWNTAYTNRITSLTTTGTSGVATLAANVLNIPNYSIAGLSPLTTKGDIFVFSTVNTRLPVGSTKGQVLQVDSGATTGLAWSTPTYPFASGSAGKILRSDGTNNVYSTFTIPDTYTTGDIIYASASNVFSALGIGSNGQVLTLAAGVPSWATPAAGFTNPMTTLGDIIYENAVPTAARLAGNTTATKKFLSQTGTGAISAAPAWTTLSTSDIPSNLTKGNVGATFDGLGGVIQINGWIEVYCAFSGTITDWAIDSYSPSTGAATSGSIVVEVYRSGASIIGAGNKPTLSSASTNSAAVSGWTSTTVTAGDKLYLYVVSITTCLKVTCSIQITKT